MADSKINVVQLQRKNRRAWTALMQSILGKSVQVTAVHSNPLKQPHIVNGERRRIARFLVELQGHSDPVSFIGKHTNRTEAILYRDIATHIPGIVPTCHYAHLFGKNGWIVLDEVPRHITPDRWIDIDVELIINQLTTLHTTFWQQDDILRRYEFAHFLDGKQYTWDELKADQAIFFKQGPGAAISEHAIHHAGRLAPLFLQAANGLTVMRELGGWPGVLGETHLTAVSTILDDPVPVLEPLRALPLTLLHGAPHPYHWCLNLFNDTRLISWPEAKIGPGICDLVHLIEQFDLLYTDHEGQQILIREHVPATEETIIDSYLLSLSGALGTQFNAREMRQAISAARCLYVISSWFPYFAQWATEMPNKYTWQKVNRMSEHQLSGTAFQPLVHFRPYFSAVFRRFLQAFRTL